MYKECSCPKTRCKRDGDCEKCEAYHRDRNNLPYCRREKSFIVKMLSKNK